MLRRIGGSDASSAVRPLRVTEHHAERKDRYLAGSLASLAANPPEVFPGTRNVDP